MDFLKLVIGFSAMFASLYIIFTGATLKYYDQRRLYQVLYVSEKLRMRLYDLSLDAFAIGFIYFVGIIIAAFINQSLNLQLNQVWTYILQIVCGFIVGIIMLFVGMRTESFEKSNKK